MPRKKNSKTPARVYTTKPRTIQTRVYAPGPIRRVPPLRQTSRRSRNRQPDPGFSTRAQTVQSQAPISVRYGFGNNVPKFGLTANLGTLPGIMLKTHAVSAAFSVTTASGVQAAFQSLFALIGPPLKWVAGTSPLTMSTLTSLFGGSASTISQLFEYAFIRRMRVRYLPENTGGTTAAGTVALCWQADPNQTAPASVTEMGNNAVSIVTPVWKEAAIVIDSGAPPKNLQEAYQIGTDSTAASKDYHMGTITVGMEDFAYGTATGTQVIGRLEVTAEIHMWGITA